MSLTQLANVRIAAEPIDGERCGFLVDRPLLPDRWVYFANSAAAENSPLAEALFACNDVASVLVAHDQVVIRRERPSPRSGVGQALRGLRRLIGDPDVTAQSWRALGKQVGLAIRNHIETGCLVASEDVIAKMPSSVELRRRVQRVLDETVNPVVAGHGGGVTIHEVIDNVLYVRMAGGCQGCGLAENTLKHGVEAAVRDEVPEILKILDVTDHASGQTPWRKR